ncbi:hypothetical protein LG299_06560 [Microbacterium lacus]|uniref:hypothetical protein n=1 Tax=Microbacterium lacus TaxID=415217 RepID=UPI00384A57AD
MIAGGVALLLLVGWGVYGLLRGPSEPQHPPATTSTTDASPPRSAEVGVGPRAIYPARDPEVFARQIADALFTWDTRATADLSEWAQVIVDVADADEALAAASDVRSYLPTPGIWQQLRSYGTRQWLVIDSVSVPDAWSTAVTQAQPGQLPPGATAFTVEGTRHREGTWGAEPVATSRSVAFTVFIACERAEPCRLLRLSQLDNPLR